MQLSVRKIGYFGDSQLAITCLPNVEERTKVDPERSLFMRIFRAAICLCLFLELAWQPAQATTYTWNASGGTDFWSTATNWSPSGIPNDGDSVIFPTTSVDDTSYYNEGDDNFAEIRFLRGNYSIGYDIANRQLYAQAINAEQTSGSVQITCDFGTILGNVTIDVPYANASLAFERNFSLIEGATVTVAGAGETIINDLMTNSSTGTTINKTGTGTLTLTGTNTASNTTINVTAGTLVAAGNAPNGSTLTNISAGAMISGGGNIGTLVNHGSIAPSTTGGYNLSFYGTLTCPLSVNTPSYVALNIASASKYDSLTLEGKADFSGSSLSLVLLNGYGPAIGTAFTLGSVEGSANTSAQPFLARPEGTNFGVGRYIFTITYLGNASGKDVVITRIGTPKPVPGQATFSRGVFAAPVSGFPGEVVRVETSPDLVTWSQVQNDLTLDSSGKGTYSQTTSALKLFARFTPVEP